MLVSSLISRSKSFSFLLPAALDFSGLFAAREVLIAEDRADGAGIVGVACRSGTAEPARRTGWRKPDLLVAAGRVEGGLDGPAMVTMRHSEMDRGIYSQAVLEFQMLRCVKSVLKSSQLVSKSSSVVYISGALSQMGKHKQS